MTWLQDKNTHCGGDKKMPSNEMLTKSQAIAAMGLGKKVSHIYFTEDEWVKLTGKLYEFEDGIFCEISEFWSARQDEAFKYNWFLTS
jgi:hypothetical protein